MILNLNSSQYICYALQLKVHINVSKFVQKTSIWFSCIIHCFCLFIFNILEKILINIQKLNTLKFIYSIQQIFTFPIWEEVAITASSWTWKHVAFY